MKFLEIDLGDWNVTETAEADTGELDLSEDEVLQALQEGHLSPEQALWLHEQQRNWEITVE
jgi:hypothetical protein